MTTYFDYKIITSSLIKAVKQATGVVCIEGNSSAQQPAYPFATFTITSPRVVNQHDTEGSQFEVVVSLTYHDSSSISVLNLAKRCESFFGSHTGRTIFSEKNVVVVDIDNFDKRDNFISIDFERTAGFDVTLRVAETFVDDVPNIDNIII